MIEQYFDNNGNFIREEITENRIPEKELISSEIQQAKRSLMDTDYQAIKYAEGQISEPDYAPIRAQRQAWRDEINRLEAEEAI